MRDKAMVARSPGVGPKVAERVVTELKDKAPKYADVDPAEFGSLIEARHQGSTVFARFSTAARKRSGL